MYFIAINEDNIRASRLPQAVASDRRDVHLAEIES
jgi:hypothetical protein